MRLIGKDQYQDTSTRTLLGWDFPRIGKEEEEVSQKTGNEKSLAFTLLVYSEKKVRNSFWKDIFVQGMSVSSKQNIKGHFKIL